MWKRFQCIQEDEDERPSMSQVVRMLKGISKSNVEPETQSIIIPVNNATFLEISYVGMEISWIWNKSY